MKILNEAQLVFETNSKRAAEDWFQVLVRDPLGSHFREAESYLGKVVSEYEDSLRKFSGEPMALELRQLTELIDLLSPNHSRLAVHLGAAKEGPPEFRSCFSEQVDSILSKLRKSAKDPVAS
jgi:hypothetical protein